MNTAVANPTTLRTLVPLFFVANITESVTFYDRILDFRITHAWEPDGKLIWCQMTRNDVGIMLQQMCAEDNLPQPRGAGVTLYIHCDDAEDVFLRLQERGVEVDPPITTFYGMKQVYVTDPDGYGLCFQNPEDSDALPPGACGHDASDQHGL
jgi:uncharacterized glyoxalase superfamily protein PhnB